MMDEYNRHPALSRRQVALFERNPVCRLCYDICLDMAEDYGGVRFDLLQSLEVADALCERILLNPWDLLGFDQYYHWVEGRLSYSRPAIACAFSTVCVTLHCIDDLPAPVKTLARDLSGLIVGEANNLYDELSSAAYRQSVSIAADSYGDIPPMPEPQRELLDLQYAYAKATTEIQTLKNQLNMQQDQTKGAFVNYGTYIAEQKNDIHDNNNCPIYVCPPNDSVPSSGAPGVRQENDSRTKKLFLTPDGIEDLQRTEEEKNRFLNYLADHHWSQRQIDCYKDNPVNKAIICFCIKWKRLKYIDKPSPAAIHRFLTETCRLTCASETAAITASLGRLLKADYDKDTFDDVENYF